MFDQHLVPISFQQHGGRGSRVGVVVHRNGEDATRGGHVSHGQGASGRLYVLLRDRKSESQTGLVPAASGERLEHGFGDARPEPTAAIRHRDGDHPVGANARAHEHLSPLTAELKCVLDQVHQSSKKRSAVRPNLDRGVHDVIHDEKAAARVAVQASRRARLGHEIVRERGQDRAQAGTQQALM